VGLGTAYERYAIHRLVQAWGAHRGIATALEGPLDGVAGMPGLHLLPLARQGVLVTVASADRRARDQVRQIYEGCGLADRVQVVAPNELAAGQRFDLVLSFNALPLLSDWRAYLAAVAERGARYLIVIVTNPMSYGARLRRLLSGADAGPEPPLYDHEATDPDALVAALEQRGTIRARTYVDCPWWPDLFVPTGQTLVGWLLAGAPRLAACTPRLTSHQFDHEPDRYPFGRRSLPRPLRNAPRRHPVFDNGPAWLGRWFGHHQAFLIEIAQRDAGPASP